MRDEPSDMTTTAARLSRRLRLKVIRAAIPVQGIVAFGSRDTFLVAQRRSAGQLARAADLAARRFEAGACAVIVRYVELHSAAEAAAGDRLHRRDRTYEFHTRDGRSEHIERALVAAH